MQTATVLKITASEEKQCSVNGEGKQLKYNNVHNCSIIYGSIFMWSYVPTMRKEQILQTVKIILLKEY